VQAAVEQLLWFAESCKAPRNLSAIKRLASETLPQELVRRWVEAVDADLKFEGEAAGAAGGALVAYGSTILTAALTESFAIYCQLGDGDILCVSDSGETTRAMTQDERLFGNETTSLCAPEAWKDFRVTFQVFSEKAPALILLATDGYANSYQNDHGFLRVGGDILSALRSDGWEDVKRSLPEWLSETSARGSGDDITVGLIARRDIVDCRQPGATGEFVE
jgi:hypothetical protein